MVRVSGFEPEVSSPPDLRDTKLHHTLLNGRDGECCPHYLLSPKQAVCCWHYTPYIFSTFVWHLWCSWWHHTQMLHKFEKSLFWWFPSTWWASSILVSLLYPQFTQNPLNVLMTLFRRVFRSSTCSLPSHRLEIRNRFLQRLFMYY